ncbi:type II secretion system F family protein [Hyphobacterium sp. SN044]|uniref:type II secretion system F family protein n=1 Tax=Hyphobacterium sp. SN044 TaxID=2912575 RepID=UPI001F19E597|nr:type II secretion system F family protein [Hyphobacterium sp. SN044]MCF8879609.1 type II secretion system F family protein [Hyphobacterium sp. SN044]
MDDIAELVTDPSFLWASIAAIMVFATIVTLTVPMMGADKLDKRIKSVQNRREELRRKSREAIEKGSSKLRGQEKRTLTRQVVESLNLQKLFEDPAIKEKLTQAGFRGNGPVMTFYFFRLAAPILLFIGAALYLMFVNDFGLPNITRWCAALGLGMLGYYAPNLYVTNAAQKRRDSIMTSFPDALDLLLICVESGMSIEAAFQKVAGEIGSQSIELAEELSLTTAELSYLQDRRMAYENLAKRTNHPGVKAVATALIQAERYGTPLGQALRVMAKENRDMRLANAEKKAASLPAKLTVPMIVFFLPVLFVVILGPAYLRYQGL